MTLHVPITILSLMLVSISFGQLKGPSTFSTKQGFCSTTYILDSIGKFYKEGGCEHHSRISLGSYQLKKDKITFNFKAFDSINPFFKIQETASLNDTTSKVTFKTYDNNIINSYSFEVDAIDTSGKFFKQFMLNDSGEIFVNPKQYQSLRLNYLQNFYGKWVYVDLKANNMEIFLNFPLPFFEYPYPKIEKGKEETYTLKADGLYNPAGDYMMFPLEK